MPDLIKKYDYPVETHKILAKDGFVLTAHRIPKQGGQPVLMVHGLFDSSSAYAILGPKKSLSFLLSDLGYDVWMLNTRGNRYSRKHKRFHRYQPQFWDFSFHELGIYDIPAAIDYVLGRSKDFQQVHYIGHSQGTTSFFVMGSERPSYMKKVKLMTALAPVAYFDFIENPIALTFAKYVPTLAKLAKTFGIHELPPENEVWRKLVYQICSFAFRNTCIYFMFEIMGIDYQQFNSSLTPLFLGHTPAGSSVKSIEHYAQQIHSGGFYKFNYNNIWENRRRHGSDIPTQYNVASVDCKVALYYGKNDRLTSVKDVQRLRDALPNVVHENLLESERFNHINFIWGNDVKTMLYDEVIEVMQKVDSGEL
ncbi:uncharacterized protein Dana_GF15803 [Drosophila ananassae]|uniref:AB hydrolase-1 domain-containing protein n=2 Tax=Drosophila ananassae TaxID=7217 RepID=B3MJK4_DROAN|nr:uncharacterized protein Dana_GF15803 [Drosophila ananassae]